MLSGFSLPDHATSSLSSHDHRLWRKSLWEGEQYQRKKYLDPGVSTSPARGSCNVAVEQCGGRDQIRKERSKEEGDFNKRRKTFVYLTINGQGCGAYMTIHRQRLLCPHVHQGIIINLKHQGHTN